MLRVGRFLHSYARHPCGWVTEEELEVPLGDGEVPATLLRPRRPGVYPGWVVLHGITVPGRAHPALQRFARSLAGSGAVVLVPEIVPWCELRVDPALADLAIAASANFLVARDDVLAGGAGVVGFSFGATQALITAAGAEQTAVRSVVSFGAYCDPLRTFSFAFTGEHEWKGVRRRMEPDPYGRWIVATNFLTLVPEYREMHAVAEGARILAMDAGRRGAYAGDDVYDKLKAELRSRMGAAEQQVWDVVAPPVGRRPDPDLAREVGSRVAAVALATHPGLDPRPHLPRLRRPTVLAHGYHDSLIPFTEVFRIREHLSSGCPAYLSVSRLFAHSREAERPRAHEYPGEVLRYVRLLNQALSS